MIGSISPGVLGVLFAIGATILWAAHSVLIRFGLDGGNVVDATTITIFSNLVFIVPVTIALHYPDFGMTPVSILAFVAVGLGSGVGGRIFQYKSTELVGASRTSPILASAGMVSALLAVVLLEETVSTANLLGIVLIVGGVMVTSWESANGTPDGTQSSGRGLALLYPIIAAFLYGIEPVIVKFAFAEGTPYLVGMSISIVSAWVGFFGYRRLRGSEGVLALRKANNLRWYVAAGISGSSSFVLYFGSLALAPVVIVAPIFQCVPVIVVGFSYLFLPDHLERITWRLTIAATVVVIGAILVSISI